MWLRMIWNKLDDVKPTSNGNYIVCTSEPYSQHMSIRLVYRFKDRFNFHGGGNKILFWVDLPELPEVDREFRLRKVIKN